MTNTDYHVEDMVSVPRPKFCNAVSMDIETLGTVVGNAILSIGLVHFDVFTGEVGETLYISFDRREMLNYGFTALASTIEWWKRPDLDKARAYLDINRMDAVSGLNGVVEWFKGRDISNGLWSRGYMDETMVRYTIHQVTGIEDPWHYQAPSDARTLMRTLQRCDIDPVEGWNDIEFVGTPHYALDDALHEAKITTCLHQALLAVSPVFLTPASQEAYPGAEEDLQNKGTSYGVKLDGGLGDIDMITDRHRDDNRG